MSDSAQDTASEKLQTPKHRSPKYPYIALDLALERVGKIYAGIRDHAQPREVVAKVYGKPATSSATIQTFATLLQYGLLENVAEGDIRRLRVSEAARDILHPHAPPDRIAAAKRKAALSPPIFAELWDKYGDATDVDDGLPLYYLTRDRASEHGSVFMERAAEEVLRVYRATVAYAGLSGFDKFEQESSEEGDEQEDNEPESKRDDDKAQKGSGAVADPPASPRRIETMRDERELQTGMLSKQGATYRIIVSGHVGVKEIERLIARLELDKEMLAEEDGGAEVPAH